MDDQRGVACTLLGMADDTQIAIVEMMTAGFKQIDSLARCVLPDIGIISGIEEAQLKRFASVEKIAEAHCELFENLKPSRGVAIIGSANETLVCRARQVFSGKLLVFEDDSVQVVASSSDGVSFKIAGLQQEFLLRANGLPLLQEAWCAIMAAREVGLSDEAIAAGLCRFQPVSV